MKKEFKIAAISSNRNSFGLHGIVVVARDGEAYQLGMSPSSLDKRKVGDSVYHGKKAGLEFLGEVWTPSAEIPEQLSPAPPAVVAELWGKKGA